MTRKQLSRRDIQRLVANEKARVSTVRSAADRLGEAWEMEELREAIVGMQAETLGEALWLRARLDQFEASRAFERAQEHLDRIARTLRLRAELVAAGKLPRTAGGNGS